MEGEPTNINHLIKVVLCEQCELRAGHKAEPNYVLNKGAALIVSSKNGEDYPDTTAVPIPGFPDDIKVAEAFRGCKHTEINEGQVVCCAIATLNRGR
jgi:hypothetical protein